MVLDQNSLNHIVQILNLEQIIVSQKIELLLFPIKIDDEFNKKVDSLKKELGHDVILKIVEEGEICNVKSIVST